MVVKFNLTRIFILSIVLIGFLDTFATMALLVVLVLSVPLAALLRSLVAVVVLWAWTVFAVGSLRSLIARLKMFL